jgi:plastocyanin
VSHLDRGTYTINVKDQGTIHNFHLTGPGVDQTTDVDGTGDFTWTVTLTDGTYTYQCDPHEATMHGTFTVGTVTSPPPSPPPPPVSPPPPPPAGSGKLPKLAGSVGPGFVLHLTKSGGGKLSSTKAASYLVTIRDLSANHNFHLFGPGVDKKTGVAFRGTVSWKVKLKKGKLYRYQCDPHKSVMKGSFKAT